MHHKTSRRKKEKWTAYKTRLNIMAIKNRNKFSLPDWSFAKLHKLKNPSTHVLMHTYKFYNVSDQQDLVGWSINSMQWSFCVSFHAFQAFCLSFNAICILWVLDMQERMSGGFRHVTVIVMVWIKMSLVMLQLSWNLHYLCDTTSKQCITYTHE